MLSLDYNNNYYQLLPTVTLGNKKKKKNAH